MKAKIRQWRNKLRPSPRRIAAVKRLLARAQEGVLGRVWESRPIRSVRRVFVSFTPLAWGLLIGGAVMLGLGFQLRWMELIIPGAGAIAILCVALWLSIRRYHASVRVSLSQERVTVGEVVMGSVALVGTSAKITPPLQILLPVGVTEVGLWTPRLKGEAVFEEPFVVSTSRRGLITVGPARAVRSDGLGVIRSVQNRSEAHSLYVHPRTVGIGAQMVGFIRDLEGVVTQDLSSADVSFRALRDYVPGDDRRSIHWRTTARVGRLMVRQFEEMRRAHLLLVIDTSADAWATPAEFEQGVSVAASLIRAAAEQSIHVEAMTNTGSITRARHINMLDELSVIAVDTEDHNLRELTERAVTATPQASITMVITGAGRQINDLHEALNAGNLDMKMVGIRMNEATQGSVHSIGQSLILEMPTVDQLARSLKRVFS